MNEQLHLAPVARVTDPPMSHAAGLVKLNRTSLSPRGNGAHLYDLLI